MRTWVVCAAMITLFACSDSDAIDDDAGVEIDASPAPLPDGSFDAPPDASPGEPFLEEQPPAQSASTTATFRFGAQGATRFTCSLDNATPADCVSPHTVTVAEGSHTMAIVAYADTVALGDPLVVTWNVDTTPPNTAIDSAPMAVDNSATPTFTFSGTPQADVAGFQCSLDGAAYAACTSPHGVTVAAGAHNFAVRAVDAAGNVDATPATHAWTYDASIVDTIIVSGPANGAATGDSVTFAFEASEPNAFFDCKLDNGSFEPCVSPMSYGGLSDGPHTFSVRALVGNEVDPTPAVRSWTVDATSPSVVITSGPASPTTATTATFVFASNDPAATVTCELDNVPLPCTSPYTTPELAPWKYGHLFAVVATDPAGNTARAEWPWQIQHVTPANPVTPITTTSFQDVTGLVQITSSSTTSTGMSIAFSTHPSATRVECYFDELVRAPCTSPVTVPFHARFEVRAYSAAQQRTIRSYSPTLNTIALTNQRRPGFKVNFGAGAGTSRCDIDGTQGPCAPCGPLQANDRCFSPASALALGAHTFTAALESNPASAIEREFYVAGAKLDVTSAPVVSGPTVTVQFTATDAASTTCSVDGAAFVACTSPFAHTFTSGGRHEIVVRAADASGIAIEETIETWVDELPIPGTVRLEQAHYAAAEPIRVQWAGVPAERITLRDASGATVGEITTTTSSGEVVFSSGLTAAGTYTAVVTSGAESKSTEPFTVTSCPSNPVVGNVRIASVEAGAPFATVTSISGTLEIVGEVDFEWHRPLIFPCLKEVGNLIIRDPHRQWMTIRLPRLRTISGNADLGGLPIVPNLTSVGGLTINNTSAFGSMDSSPKATAPRLRRLGSLGLELDSNDVRVVGLEQVWNVDGALTVSGSDTGGTTLPGLAGLIRIGGSLDLDYIAPTHLSRLHTVGGTVTLWTFQPSSIDYLVGLEQIGSGLSIMLLENVPTIAFPVLQEVGGTGISITPGSTASTYGEMQTLSMPRLRSVPSMSVGAFFYGNGSIWRQTFDIASRVDPFPTLSVTTP